MIVASKLNLPQLTVPAVACLPACLLPFPLPLTRFLLMAVVIWLKHHLGKIVLMMLISPHTLDSLECFNGVFQSLFPPLLLAVLYFVECLKIL